MNYQIHGTGVFLTFTRGTFTMCEHMAGMRCLNTQDASRIVCKHNGIVRDTDDIERFIESVKGVFKETQAFNLV